MSLRATSWAWEIPTQEIGMTNKFVLLALADYADKDGICFPSQATLGDKVALSERTVRASLSELEEAGFITRTNRSSTAGRRSDWIQLELESPRNRQNLPVAQPEKSRICNRQKTPPPTGSPLPVATKCVLNQSDITPQCDRAAEIYQAYPRKEARPTALKAITKALQKTPADELLRLTKEYATAVARAGVELRFIPHPATWYNQERYNDGPESWVLPASGRNGAPAVPFRRPLTFEQATANLPNYRNLPVKATA